MDWLIEIKTNGSKFLGDASDGIEKFIERLNKHWLREFSMRIKHINTVEYCWNFDDISAAFHIFIQKDSKLDKYISTFFIEPAWVVRVARSYLWHEDNKIAQIIGWIKYWVYHLHKDSRINKINEEGQGVVKYDCLFNEIPAVTNIYVRKWSQADKVLSSLFSKLPK